MSRFSKPRVLVTGSNGFIGSRLSRELAEAADVVGFTRPYSRRHPYNTCRQEILFPGTGTLAEELAKNGPFDVVIHAAATVSWDAGRMEEILQNNVQFTRQLAEAAVKSGTGHFIFISAGARFGFSRSPADLIDETRIYEPSPQDPYAYSKYLAERELETFRNDMAITVVYPSTVYGDGDMKLNSGTLVKLLKNRRLPVAFPGGTSCVAIGDLCGAIARIATGPAMNPIRRFILSSENVSYRDLFARIDTVLHGRRSPRAPIPRWLRAPGIAFAQAAGHIPILRRIEWLKRGIIEGFFSYRYFSTRLAESEIAWKPGIRLEDAVRIAYDFYVREGLM